MGTKAQMAGLALNRGKKLRMDMNLHEFKPGGQEAEGQTSPKTASIFSVK